MKRIHFLFLLALMQNCYLFAQSKPKLSKPNITAIQTNKLVGTWQLIEFADRDSATSAWTFSYGKNPKGYFTYTASGIVNLNICAETPSKISKDSASKSFVNLQNWLDSNSIGYFGTYTVNFKTSIITHHVKGGSMPWYIDTDQPRPFILKSDTLIIGDNKTWKRVLVKVD